jgi:ubiquinone/menaquinone biosynthesis C-methylase UbiE
MAFELSRGLNDVNGRMVLEIGCGRGGFAARLAASGGRVTGADYSSSAVAVAASSFPDCGVTWVVEDIQKLSFGDATFDYAFSCETIEHVPDPRRALSELSRVLKPDGTLILTAPNYLGTMGLYRAYMRLTGRRFTEEGQPINNFTMLPLTLLWLRRAGFVIEEVKTRGQYLPVPRRPPVNLRRLENFVFFKPFGLHTAIRARKRGAVA